MAIHVYPVNDLKEHDTENTTCECCPAVVFEEGEMIVVHNSFDGREDGEEAMHRKPQNLYTFL